MKTNMEEELRMEIEDQEETIIFGILEWKTSGYINFIKRNDPLTTYQIQFLWSQIELNELSPR